MKTAVSGIVSVLLLGPFGSPGGQTTAGAPEGAELAGRVSLTMKSGSVPGEGTVVWLPDVRPQDPGQEPRLVSKDKRFQPHVLGVEAGTQVTFPNLDKVYHNVFSLSAPNAFDLGLYRGGAARSVTLKTPGLVRIYCNIHPDMAAYVMVLDGSAFAVAGPDGSFHIGGIPPGRHLVKVWNEKGGDQQATLDFAAGKIREYPLALDASAYRLISHKNKHGQDYPPVRDEDRY